MAQQKDTVIVHFEFNYSTITEQAGSILDSIVNLSASRKLQPIVLYGHCDFIGNNDYNDSLSRARINSVKEYLTAKGVPATLFRNERAYGERKPLAVGNSEEARAINRRVELIFEAAPPNQTLANVIKDTATKTGTRLILENLNFVGGRHILLEESMSVLGDLLKAMQDNPTVKIEIHGYVCCTFGDADGPDLDLGTNDLSVQRAKVVYNYLVERGIDSNRLSYQGFGGARKLYPNEENEFERSRNRRVEIKIVDR